MPSDTRVPETPCEAVKSEMASRLRGNVQRCPVCYETFTATSSGDAHRIIVSTCDLVRVEGKLLHVQLERNEKGQPIIPEGFRLLSSGNQVRRCLTPDELEAKGFRRDKNGRWGQPGNGVRWWDGPDETYLPPEGREGL